MPALKPPPAPSRPAPPVEEERPRPDPPPVIIKRGDADALAASALALRKREWLLETIDAHRRLSLAGQALERRTDLSREAFFEDYYARHRPVILAGEMADWPALSKWTASYLRAQVGDRMVEYQGDRDGASNYEPNKVAHRRRATFDAFMDQVERSRTGNDAYLTAFNSATNAEIFAPLMVEVGRLEKFLAYDRAQNPGMPWIGGAGSFTPLHRDGCERRLRAILDLGVSRLCWGGVAGTQTPCAMWCGTTRWRRWRTRRRCWSSTRPVS